MSIRVAIEHRTVYRYDRPVTIGPHRVRLRPAPHCRTPILAYALSAEPAAHFVKWQQDPFANHVARYTFTEPARELSFRVDLIADLAVINPFDFFLEDYAERWPFEYPPEVARDLAPFIEHDESGPRLEAWLAGGVPPGPMQSIDFLVECNRRVLADVAYSTRMEPGVLTPEQTLERGVGSCRDSAWLLVQALRAHGLAARFVSGYLVQLEDDAPDKTDLHAWAEAFLPGAGWIGLDPTSGLLAGEGHIPLACAATPDATAPITGTVSGGEAVLEHANLVSRLDGPPGPSQPFTEPQWERIDTLGHAVDTALADADVRLTMGGEPTFVATAELDRPEWRIAALGGRKHELGADLATRLAAEFAPSALITHTQGKWYPGEPIPRWQIGIHWRTDGRPLWRDPSLLADPATEGTAELGDAETMIAALCIALGLPSDDSVLPACEDLVATYWDAARVPGAVPPQATVPDVGRAGSSSPIGWVLPLAREAGEPRWRSDTWRLQRGALYLIPGDGPIGARLPLNELTWTPNGEEDPDRPASTALCAQTRNGHVHVYLPPVEDFAYWAELVTMLEDVTAALAQRIVVEGYGPPRDARANKFVVTPDPGVLEINIHPSGSWPELVSKTQTINDQATTLGLECEKFALDGRHDSTGGGSHITLGGATAEDSPLLRRPALLRSMLTYWQHHPALSYAFSGRFVGPTSQAPRVDEARHESLYELEIAFDELEHLRRQGQPPLWQVDRLFRHLLTDLTGNTHRAEFCIDKLYSPDSASGRLGVLELRGFEMAPHPRMQLLQALLVRALVARLWEHPYSGALVRWGTELHDRFVLPWWIEHDLESIVDDLGRHGFGFELEWFAPFLEFRFPRLGSVSVAGVTLELREAIEPWHVLGEEQGSSGTARYVDSSVQRLQVRVDGMIDERYLVTCNGYVVPLQPTEVDGTAVAGVRYRASSPWSALHPTIGVQAPLTFDLVDTWSERSLGGCRYHVSDPGGSAYDRVPVNAGEAEARRRSRFEPLHHSGGNVVPARSRRSKEYPRTLDLRRAGFRR